MVGDGAVKVRGARLCLCHTICGRVMLGSEIFVTSGAGPCRLCQAEPLALLPPSMAEPTDVSEHLGSVTADAMSRPRAGAVPTGTGLPFWIWLWVTGGIPGPRCRLGRQ